MLGSQNASAQIKERQPTAGGPPVISVKEGMLTYRAKNRPLRSLLEEIGDQAGVAVVLGDGVGQEQVSVEFKNFRLDEALRQIAKDYDTFFFYGMEKGKEAASLKAVWIYPATQGRRLKPVAPETWASTQEFERMLGDRHPEARARALDILIERLGQQAENLVMKALRDDSDLVRTRALDQALSWDLAIPQETLTDLALHDKSVNVRFLALGALSDEPNSRWVAQIALQDPDEYLRNTAREILRQLDAVTWPSSLGQSAANKQRPPR
jgi:hypothetical protein